MFYGFLLNMWIMKKIDEQYLQGQVDKRRITLEEKGMIIINPQVN